MKTNKTLAMTVVAVIVLGLAAGCGPKKNSKKAAVEPEPAASETIYTAIDKYLAEEIAPNYAPAEITIPLHTYISVDECNPEDIVVLGDYWIFNYDQCGDTLKTVSGGNHAGMMHIRPTEDGHFEIVSFDQVLDGADNDPSAKKIFGDKYPEYAAAHSDGEKREEIRKDVIASYVQSHNLPVKVYKDFGWPAVEIPSVQ